MFGNLGFGELMIILVIVLVLFGAKRIPEISASFGKGIREFNDAKNNVRRELEDGMNEPPRQPTATNNKAQSTTTTTQS